MSLLISPASDRLDDPLVSSHSASAPLPSDGYPTFETSTQVLGGFSRPRLVANHSTPNSFTPSIPQSPISPGHIRNASASSSTATARPMQKPQLRSKKSLPELRIGQSPSPSSSTFSTGPTPANEDGKFPALPSPSAAIKFSELHHPRQDANKGDEDNKTAGERNSGAYFKRLSMLPANTASKALPSHLIELVDGIRGILFSLSQVYSALKQFVSFATQERLPAAFTKCLASADVSMGNLINALDRFDSSSRRRHSAEDACQIARDVLEACRENVATYAKLVGVLRFQLKSLTAHADSRYVRTLLLMLYGALGEVGVAWKAMAPHAEPVGQFLMSNTPSSTSTTPSAQHLHPSTSTSAPERTTPTLEMPPPSRKQAPSPLAVARAEPNKPSSENLSARARRHAGSFSTEDVQMGAVMPPAPSPSLLPPTSAITYSSSVPSPSVTTSSNTLQTPAVQSTGTLRPRPTAPALTALSNLSSMPYMDLMATLEGQPPTPMSAVPPTPNIHHQHPQAASLRQIQPTSGHNQKPQASKHNDQQRTHRPTQRSGSQPLPSASIMPPRSASFSNSSQPVSPYTAKPVDQDFFEMAEQTTNVAFSVCNMLVESLSDAGEKGVSKGTRDLLEMCDMTNERARRLANTLESAKRAESGQSAEVLAIANRHLSDESGLFAQVSQIHSLY